MNPLTNMKNVLKLSERDLGNKSKSSWHDQYQDSAWIFVGGLPFDLTEGDLICIFSQYGEVVNINLVRDKDNGKSKGFCFICYEDQRSTILAVDNFNGIKILGRIIRVDHVADYKVPKEGKKTDDTTKQLNLEGCAPKPTLPLTASPPRDFRETIADQIESDIKLPPRLPIYPIKKESEEVQIKRENSDAAVKVKKKKKSKRKSNDYSDTELKKHKHKKRKKEDRGEKRQKSSSGFKHKR